jgi:hypothetical protein
MNLVMGPLGGCSGAGKDSPAGSVARLRATRRFDSVTARSVPRAHLPGVVLGSHAPGRRYLWGFPGAMNSP